MKNKIMDNEILDGDDYESLNNFFMRDAYLTTGCKLYKDKLTDKQKINLAKEEEEMDKMMDDIIGPSDDFDIFDENNMEDDE